MRALAYFADQAVNGGVLFAQECPHRPVHVRIAFHGPPGETHAIHIHEYGDMTRGCESLGAHHNPSGTTHGSRNFPNQPRHAGDLINNLTFDSKGDFLYAYDDDLLTLFGSDTIYGRSVVIHADPDDLGRGQPRADSLKTGNAGRRIACAIISKIADS